MKADARLAGSLATVLVLALTASSSSVAAQESATTTAESTQVEPPAPPLAREQIRPTHMLSVETGHVRATGTFVLSAFGNGLRFAAGVAERLELRLDGDWTTTVGVNATMPDGTTGRGALTLKWGLVDVGPVALAVQVSGAVDHQSGTTFGDAAARMPLSLTGGPVTVALVPVVRTTFGQAATFRGGGEFGLAVDIGDYVALLAEGSVTYGEDGVVRGGYAAGVAIKVLPEVTIPIVLAARTEGNQDINSVGIVDVFMHVGVRAW